MGAVFAFSQSPTELSKKAPSKVKHFYWKFLQVSS